VYIASTLFGVCVTLLPILLLLLLLLLLLILLLLLLLLIVDCKYCLVLVLQKSMEIIPKGNPTNILPSIESSSFKYLVKEHLQEKDAPRKQGANRGGGHSTKNAWCAMPSDTEELPLFYFSKYA